jgi:nucleotide-binding universal stress UspA family protein
MYKHILIPTDGSKLADKAVVAGLEFARKAKAKVTWFTAMPEYKLPSEGEIMARRGLSIEEHEKAVRAKAQQMLKRLQRRARAAGVACEGDYALSDRPAAAIIAAAQRHGCDLIFMASHGRRGVAALVHGSETRDVLTRSKIPTLVYR